MHKEKINPWNSGIRGIVEQCWLREVPVEDIWDRLDNFGVDVEVLEYQKVDRLSFYHRAKQHYRALDQRLRSWEEDSLEEDYLEDIELQTAVGLSIARISFSRIPVFGGDYGPNWIWALFQGDYAI